MVPPQGFLQPSKNATKTWLLSSRSSDWTTTVGVRQGDNMAPVLFLFLMSAFAETLEAEWRAEGIDVCTVRSITGAELAADRGKIRGHLPKEYLSNKLTAIKILQCLYVDDGAIIFSSRASMTCLQTLCSIWIRDAYWKNRKPIKDGMCLLSPPQILQLSPSPQHCKPQWQQQLR